MTAFKSAAIELLNRRKFGTKAPRMDESIRPKSIEDALAIQSEMANIATLGGWKCLLPPAADKIIAAPIFNVQQNTDTVELYEDNLVARVEPEICFILSKNIPIKSNDYSETEIVDSIGSAHMALELMQSRFADGAGQSFYENLADCMFNQGVYVGPELDKNTAINTSKVKITVAQGAKVREFEGEHPNKRAIDGLIWLVNYMNARGVELKAGAVIITGSFKGIVDMTFDIETTISYEGLGEYQVNFIRKI